LRGGLEQIMPVVFNLIVTEGEKKDEVYPVIKFPFRIGRMPDNDIVFNDKRVSRYHSEIVLKDDVYIIEDLGSRNGTIVNAVKVTSTKLKLGDRITIGENTLLFDSESEKEDIFSEEDKSDVTTIKPAKAILKDVMEESVEDSSVDILKRRTEILNALYQISRSILKEFEVGNIFNLIAEAILRNIGAERVYILAKDKDSKSIKPLFMVDIHTRIGQYLIDAKLVTKTQIQEALSLQKKEGGRLGSKLVKLGYITEEKLDSFLSKQSSKKDKLMLSRTVINRVMDEEISLLVADAKRDSRFKQAESIFLYGIRSAMCVPLLGAETLAGTLYADVLNADRQFTRDELDLLTTIGNLAAICIEEANLRDKIRRESEARQSLMRYHSPQIVEEIIKGKGTCEVNERMVTILFTDIKGFTRLSEEIGPMETAELLNEYFDIITEVVFRYNGSIDKFIGDAAMAIFGAPFQEEGYTENAVRAAIDIQKEIKKLNRFEVRIGINTGYAVIGNIGSTKRVEYTAIGDTVNIASRLEKMAGPGKIYIGAITHEQIRSIFNTRPLGTQKVKGKIMEIDIYEVLI
jgi:adenylate cyclase